MTHRQRRAGASALTIAQQSSAARRLRARRDLGELDTEEYARRLERVFSARSTDELDAAEVGGPVEAHVDRAPEPMDLRAAVQAWLAADVHRRSGRPMTRKQFLKVFATAYGGMTALAVAAQAIAH